MGNAFTCLCTKDILKDELQNQSTMLQQHPPPLDNFQDEPKETSISVISRKKISPNNKEENNNDNSISQNENSEKIERKSNKEVSVNSNFSSTNKNNKTDDLNYLKSTVAHSNNNSNNLYYNIILSNAEKLFDKPLDFSKGYLKYSDNKELKDLAMNNIPKENTHFTDGINIEINGKKCFYRGSLDENGKLEGYGELFSEDGDKFEGIFKNNSLSGLGRYISSDGNCLEGIFSDFDIISKASIFSKDEKNKLIKYFGMTKDLKKNGKGKEFSEDYNYDGYFVDGLKEGKGKIFFKKYGDSYEGDFHADKINGRGFYLWQNKESYVGDFVDAKMHGKGVYKWPDGSQYEGEYVNNIKEGTGTYKWKDGRIYQGNFEMGRPHGYGYLTLKGVTVECEYRNGKCVGDIGKIIEAKLGSK